MADRCTGKGIAVIAQLLLGGPRREGRLARRQELVEIADARGATPWKVALAWLLQLAPAVVAIPGARRPETARSAARAATLGLENESQRCRPRRSGEPRPARRTGRRPAEDADVVLVMGIPGAGKSRVAEEYVARGYVRLNRDERGGTLRELAAALDEELSSGLGASASTTRTSRAPRAATCSTSHAGMGPDSMRPARHAARPGAGQPRRKIARALRFASVARGAAAVARREPGVHAPTSQMRTVRELEPPSADEGFAGVEQLPFTRSTGSGRAGVFVAAAAFREPDWKRHSRAGRPPRASPSFRLEARRRSGGARRSRFAPRGRGLGPCRERAVPASRRPTDLLVPAAASGPGPRLREGARRRSVTIDPHRNLVRTPDARDDPRRALRRGLSQRTLRSQSRAMRSARSP